MQLSSVERGVWGQIAKSIFWMTNINWRLAELVIRFLFNRRKRLIVHRVDIALNAIFRGSYMYKFTIPKLVTHMSQQNPMCL